MDELVEAIKVKDIRRVEDLIETADLSERDEFGWTPLNWAAGVGNIEIVQLLIGKGVDIFSVGRDQRTPYQIAIAAAHIEVAKLLKEAEKNQGNDDRETPSQRKFCKAYSLAEVAKFPDWGSIVVNGEDNDKDQCAEDNSDEATLRDIVFVHQDFTVTRSMWEGEDVIINNITDEWISFCINELNFKVPDDFDLII